MAQAEVKKFLESLENNPLVSLQRELMSYYLIDKHVKTSPAFNYISPVEIKLPPNEDGSVSTYQYIPIIETLAAIDSDPTMIRTKPTAGDMIQDIFDGSVWRDSEYFRENPDAYTGMLYTDACEICNPLGPRKGVHKIVPVYLSIVDLTKPLRSKTENVFLVMLVSAEDMKKHKKTVFKTLIDDLLLLEKGVQVGSRTIKLGIVAYVADNLESHFIGGFSCNFASRDICRSCHLQYVDLPNISGVLSSKQWTEAEYDADAENLENGQVVYGLTDWCMFNELSCFHAVGQLPYDCMHDFLEKVGACDVHAAVLALVSEGRFTINQLNEMQRNLKLKHYESSNRPLPIKAQSEKLQGNALTIAMQIRYMPYTVHQLVGDCKPGDSPALDLLLLLHQLQDYMMADALNPADIMGYEETLVLFFDTRKKCVELYTGFSKIVPKYHFLEHYAEQMRRFGPILCTWTARFESKHQDFKNWAEASKNWINLLKTLAEKNQKKMASRYTFVDYHSWASLLSKVASVVRSSVTFIYPILLNSF